MKTDLKSLLAPWIARSEETQWVLGTVYKTVGSAYRKAGAMMLFNGYGEQYGLLSGGCLESDIQLKAKKVMQTGRALTHCYDATDEDDLSFQLGIGCGGKVYILLQPITGENDLGLRAIYAALSAGESGIYKQLIAKRGADVIAEFTPCDSLPHAPRIYQDEAGETWFETPIKPEPHLLVIGGGVDVQPIAIQAATLGWTISLCDPRPANARAEHFPQVDTVIRSTGDELSDYIRLHNVEAVIIMSHSLRIDSEALKTLQKNDLRYLALLGPTHRTEEVLELAGLSYPTLACPLHSPAGLDLGGEGPATIALSVMAQCHAILHEKMAQSLAQQVA